MSEAVEAGLGALRRGGALNVFAGVPADEYQTQARVRSPKWGTVNMPVREFAKHVRPVADWL